MKIFAGYQITEEPWGGANNFLRNLYQYLQDKHGAAITYTASPDCDVFFFGQMGMGPACGSRQYSSSDVAAISSCNPLAPVIMRMVNLRGHAVHDNWLTYVLNLKDWSLDNQVRKAASLCDKVIFQSHYQKNFFDKLCVPVRPHQIIHNGAADEFSHFSGDIKILDGHEDMVVVSSSVSMKSSKNHSLIAKISNAPGVIVRHAGAWPPAVDVAKVQLLGTITHKEMVEHCQNAHFFLHPGIKESCSNSIVEALGMGLPVLYGDGPGSSAEIVGDYGLRVGAHNLVNVLARARSLQPDLVARLRGARQEYSMGHTAQLYYQIFIEAIAGKKARMSSHAA